MTCAVAQAVMEGGQRDAFIDAMKKYGWLYGGRIRRPVWRMAVFREPGAVLQLWQRRGHAGLPLRLGDRLRFRGGVGQVVAQGPRPSRASAEVTHNHPEGIKGALAAADAIILCRWYFEDGRGAQERPAHGDLAACKQHIKAHVEREYGYDLSRSLDAIRPGYCFNVTCQETVPQAIIAFLESRDFEDAIRNAISLGGDSDTLAAITGSIAEAAYGIPDWIQDKACSYLDKPLKDVCTRWEQYIASRGRANDTF